MLLLLTMACAEGPELLSVPVFHRPGPRTLQTPTGTLTLSEATWRVHTLRLETAAQASRSRPLSLAWIPSAQAHPGHGGAGEVWGELLGAWELDLLAEEPEELGLAQVYTGELATASLALSGVSLRGEVEGGQPFDLALELEETVTGVPIALSLSADRPGALVLEVDLAHALSFVDWQQGDNDGDGTLSLGDGATENTLAFGVLSTPSLNLNWEE